MDKKKKLFLDIFDPPPLKMRILTKNVIFDQKNAIFGHQGQKTKKIIMDSYVHFIYEDIVWYEILISDNFLTPQNGGSVPKNAIFGH